MEHQTEAIEDGRRRYEALSKWTNDLDSLLDASDEYIRSCTSILKLCPLNDTAPLPPTAPDGSNISSVSGAFDTISRRLFEVSLVEQRVGLSRASLEVRRNRVAGISKISRLPEELLCNVFRHVLWAKERAPDKWTPFLDAARAYTSRDADLELKGTIISRPELILTWVCKHWRDVALNLPELFCELDFHKEPLPFVRTNKYLIRSQEAELDIVLKAESKPDQPFLNPDVYMITAIGILLPHFNRWKSLTLSTTSVTKLRQCLLAMCFYGRQGQGQRIRRIYLASDTRQPLVQLFDAPLAKLWEKGVGRLGKLTLKGVAVQWEWSLWWSRLEHLELAFQEGYGHNNAGIGTSHPTPVQFNRILHQCPNMKTLSLSDLRFFGGAPQAVDNDNNPEESRLACAELISLRTLRLVRPGPSALPVLLHMVDAPNINSLLLDIGLAPEPLNLQAVLFFFLRYEGPRSSIRKLWLSWGGNAQKSDSAEAIISKLENLEELTLANASVLPDTASTCLIPHPGSPLACPKLVLLRLYYISFQFDWLERLVELRYKAARVQDLSQEEDLGLPACSVLETLHVKCRPSARTSTAGSTATNSGSSNETPITPAQAKRIRGYVKRLVWEQEPANRDLPYPTGAVVPIPEDE